ncbi:MAG: CotH kinase family protein [Desulfobacterales bacterium]|nr:CotH kinase family protein [Desulfobacterales bacterium]
MLTQVKWIFRFVWIVMISLILGCNGSSDSDSITGNNTDTTKTEDNDLPLGWAEDTHSNDAKPYYDVVFPDNEVNRIDLQFASEDWQAMLDNMTELYGEFGKRDQMQPDGENMGPVQMPAGGENPIPAMNNMRVLSVEACLDKLSGDACRVSINENKIEGTCEFRDDELMCRPATIAGQNQPPQGDMNQNFLGSGENPIYKPCTLYFEGKTWWHVGVRFKGNSSLMSSWGSGIMKLPLRLDLDEFEDDYPEIKNQRFYGFKKLSLSSNFSDNSLIREKVTADIFREAGVPAPRTAFYRVFIDYGQGPVYFGLYTMVEIPDEPMLKTQFQKKSGNLYKPTSNFVTFTEDQFDKETNEDEADFSDVISVFTALHADRSQPEIWRNGLESVLDVDGFIRWLAVNTVIQNWDTYGRMAHNYYLYTDPGDGLVHWIPWDNNMALGSGMGVGIRNEMENEIPNEMRDDMRGGMGQTLSLSLSEVTDRWPLIRYLMDDPIYQRKYVSYVSETINDAFSVVKIQVRYQQLHDLVRPYVVGEQGEIAGYTYLQNKEDFDTALDQLMSHVEQRKADVLEFIQTQ